MDWLFSWLRNTDTALTNANAAVATRHAAFMEPFKLVGSIIKQSANLVLGPINMILAPFKLLGGVVSLVVSAIKAGAGLISSVFHLVSSTILTGIKTVAVTLIGVIAGLVGAFKVFVQNTQELARDIATIRNQTGLGNMRSANLVWQMGAYGIGAKDIAQMTSNPANMPFLFNMRAHGLGLPGYESPNFIPELNRWFQAHSQTQMGRLMSNNLLNNYLFAGGAPAGMLQLANIPSHQVAEQANWMQKTMHTIGIDPNMLMRYADELPLITTRISLTLEMLKVKFSTLLFPMVEKLLNLVSSNLSGNLDGIVNFIIGVARWMYVDLPDYLVKGAQIGLTAIDWLVNGFFFMAQGAVNLVKALEVSGSSVNVFIIKFLRVVDVFIKGIVAVANILITAANHIHTITGAAGGFAIGSLIGTAAGAGIGALIGGLAGGVGAVPGALAGAAVGKWAGGALGGLYGGYLGHKHDTKNPISPVSLNVDLAGYYARTIQPAIAGAHYSDKSQKTLDTWRESAMSGLGSLSGQVAKYAKEEAATRKDREKSTNKIVDATNKNTDAVRDVVAAVRGLKSNSDISGQKLLGRVLSYIAEDDYRALVSSQ